MSIVDAGEGLELASVASRGLRLTALRLAADGGTITGAFTTPLVSGTLSGNFRGADYASLGPAVHPASMLSFSSLDLYISPSAPGVKDVWASYSGELAGWSSYDPVDAAPRLSYRDPLPASWSRFVSATATFLTPTRLAGTTTGGVSGTVGDLWPLAQVPAVFAPRLSPPTAFMIGTALASGTGTLLTLQPGLRWAAPARGTASGYQVRLYKLVAAGTRTTKQPVLELFTTTTSMTVPPGVMTAGGTWVFAVDAVSILDGSFADEPFAFYTSISSSTATAVSGLWVTP